MNEIETKTVLGCGHCWYERGELEATIACLKIEDGVREWFWWCRVCKRQTGWGVQLPVGTIDFGLGKLNEANDFEVFDKEEHPVGIFPW